MHTKPYKIQLHVALWYLLYKAEKPSFYLTVRLHFWQADNSVNVVSASIKMELAQNESCIFEEHKIYFYEPTKPTVHQKECVEDEYEQPLTRNASGQWFESHPTHFC